MGSAVRLCVFVCVRAGGGGVAALRSKKEGKDQESIQSSTTLDSGYQWESDNVTIEPRGQPFPSR